MARSVAPGRVLGGRYRLDQEIARGGMATVWRGEDPLLARAVAVKTLDPTLAEDEALRTRFRREAVAAAAVAHPNIVATYDTGEDDGVAYIVMELVEGATLRQAIDLHGALPPARAADIGAQVGDALAAAHARGLVHRDVKPSNVLVQLDGRVKVTDFGIAKAADQVNDDLTRAGNVMGTARYLAPEQLEGHQVDERADVYSLGLVMYEMLTGRPPFGADTELATAVARLTTAPPAIGSLRAGVPPGLTHVVERALERDPDRRWPNAAAMRDALAPFRIAAPDRTADATMPVALPPRPRPEPVTAAPMIVIDDGIGVGARVLIWILAVGLGFGLGYAGYVVATGDNGTKKHASTPHTTVLPISAIRSFDPDGDGAENDADLGLAKDGDETTAWATEGYLNPTTAPKHGVGFVLDLGRTAAIDSVRMTSPLTGWAASIYVAAAPATALTGWGQPVATGTGLGTRADLPLDHATNGRYVLVWFTTLVKEADGRYRARVNEVSVRGVAS
ncbi:MAG: protein kinase domain-containing protein [Acidimicrobiia bacterium]